MTRQRKNPRPGGLLQDKRDGAKFGLALYDTGSESPCQAFTLSPDSLSRAAFLAGDLACWLLRRLPAKNLPDPAFLPLYERALFLLEVEDKLLRQAYELELVGGEL